MNKSQTFEQFLANQVPQISPWGFLLNLALTAVLAYLLGRLYARFGNSLSNKRIFASNFELIAVTTMIIITIVKSSLALSLEEPNLKLKGENLTINIIQIYRMAEISLHYFFPIRKSNIEMTKTDSIPLRFTAWKIGDL